MIGGRWGVIGGWWVLLWNGGVGVQRGCLGWVFGEVAWGGLRVCLVNCGGVLWDLQ